MLKHILVGIDFSSAWPRIEAQIKRLPPLGCERVTLAYVISEGYTQAPELTHREHYESRLAEIADTVATTTGLSVDWTVRTGRVDTELIAAAEANGADTILLGSQGHNFIHDFMLGSTALNVARITDRPLCLAPVNGSDEIPGEETCRPLLATDGSSAAAGAEAAFLNILQCCGRGVIASVGRWDNDADTNEDRAVIEDHINDIVQKADTHAIDTVLAGHGKPSRQINRIAEEQEANLIIVGRRGHNPLRELLLGSTAEALCRNSTKPVLLVPEAVAHV